MLILGIIAVSFLPIVVPWVKARLTLRHGGVAAPASQHVLP